MGKKAAIRRAKETDSQLARELRKLAEILDAKRICPDVSPLQAGIGYWYDNDSQKPGWSYRIEDLLFPNIVVSKRCLPPDLLDLACRLSAHVRGYYGVSPTEDPLSHVEIEITLEARDVDKRRLISSWHFDRHVGDIDETEKENPDQATHPRYHFHFGGDRMKTFAKQNEIKWFPHLLLMDGPRPAHPPLDAILAIDFVLSNFLATQWRSLRETSDYMNVVGGAQKRLWKPYADTLPRYWMPNEENEYWLPHDCWPNLSAISNS